MKPSTPSLGLRGIVPPMITPLRGRDEIDVPGLEKLVEHILAGGVHGLFILGTSGEAPSLSYRLRRDLIDRVTKQVGGRLPVLVGITDTSFVECVDLATHAASRGAQALVMATPYYFPPSQLELSEYLQRLIPELPLPVFLYNMPQMTKVSFALETVRRATQIPNIIGVKDSGGDLGYFDQLLALQRERPDWSFFVGPENLMAETVRRGGSGGVNGGANFHPRLFVELYNAVIRGDESRATELQRTVELVGHIYSVGQHASAVVKGIKCSCSLLGLCDDFMAEPFHHFRAPERAKIAAILTGVGLLK